MTSPEEPSPPKELVRSLLRSAGVRGTPESLTLLGVSTCSVWALAADDRRYVVRYRLGSDPELAAKESFLSELLRRHHVPAAVVLAMAAGEHGVATLSTRLPGIRLDRATETLSPTDLSSAWRSTGEALRRAHEIALPETGEIVGDRVEPFPGGWSKWVTGGLKDDVLWLQSKLGGARVDALKLEQVVAAAEGALRGAPARLIHNDALPQNVLVAAGARGWMCTGWLDWEFARAGDPLWDVGTLDFRPAGLVPAAFYEGYGSRPAEPEASIYELLMATWRTRAELEHGFDWSWPTQQARMAYLRSLPDQVDRLAGLLRAGKA